MCLQVTNEREKTVTGVEHVRSLALSTKALRPRSSMSFIGLLSWTLRVAHSRSEFSLRSMKERVEDEGGGCKGALEASV